MKKQIVTNKENKLTYEQYEKLREISLELIHKYHKNDIDKGGNPYINHLIRVSNECKTYEAKIAGLLHDIIEDTSCHKEVLLDSGIPNFVVDIILIVSRKKEETYSEFIDRIIESNNKYAMELKCCDLKDNTDLSRLDGLSDKEIKKMEKMIIKRYIPALLKLEEKIKRLV